jgi:hypothetical protein
MSIEEQIRQIMLSKELSDTEKLDRLHALIPLESFEIDNLNQATPAQLKQLRNGIAITEAMQQVRRQMAGSPHQPYGLEGGKDSGKKHTDRRIRPSRSISIALAVGGTRSICLFTKRAVYFGLSPSCSNRFRRSK